MSSERLVRARLAAATTRSTPTAIEASPSQADWPVSCRRPTPAAASTSPISAATSSKITALTVVSVVRRRYAKAGTA